MDVEKIIVLLGIVATAFKAVTSGLKDLDEIKKTKKKRRTPGKKKRRS
ncbi:hypothetical protein MM326_11070 [Alkalihalobacillus sp. LMS6]|nr:hypothetical protein [Alkalihalobacillus sp. LMS6]UTR04682.1 hypothetical protein MM326_11070 [Alkalihalobacillus sp. LMS6]